MLMGEKKSKFIINDSACLSGQCHPLVIANLLLLLMYKASNI